MAEEFCHQHNVAGYIKWQATGRALEKACEKDDNSFTLKAFFGANAWISLEISSSEFMSLLMCELKAVNCPHQPIPVEAVIQERGEYLYDVIYKPRCKGRYELHLSFTGIPILDSPYSVIVTYQNDKLENRLTEISGVKSPWGAVFTQEGSLAVSERGETGCISTFWLNGIRQGSSTAPQQVILNPNSPQPKRVAADLDLPCGIAVADRRILVADRNDHCIKTYDCDSLHFIKKFGNKGIGSNRHCTKFTSPTGIAFNSKNGKIYVTDFYHCVQVFHSADSFFFSHSFGKKGSGEGQLLQPWGIACDVNGKVYVADSGNERIQIFTEEGKFLNSIDMKFQYPLAVAVGPCGEIYVACPSTSRKESTSADNSYHTQSYVTSHITVFRHEGGKYINYYSIKEFVYPCGLAVDESGVLCVCDGGTNSLVLF